MNLYTVLIFSTKCSKITFVKNLWIKNLNGGTYYEKTWELKVMERKNVSYGVLKIHPKIRCLRHKIEKVPTKKQACPLIQPAPVHYTYD